VVKPKRHHGLLLIVILSATLCGQGHNMWRGWFESQRLTEFMIDNALEQHD